MAGAADDVDEETSGHQLPTSRDLCVCSNAAAFQVQIATRILNERYSAKEQPDTSKHGHHETVSFAS